MTTEQIGFSVASLAGHSLKAAVSEGEALGLAAIEVLGFEGERHSQGDLCGFAFAERSAEDLDRLGAAVAGYARVSTHAPFIAVPLLSPNVGVRREGFRQAEACVRGTGRIGGTVCTVHLNPLPFHSWAEVREEAVSALRRLADIGSECGVRVAVETGWPNTVDEYCGVIEDADHEYVGACIDVGHIFHYYPRSLRGTPDGVSRHNDILNLILDRLGHKLAVFHLHDNRRSDFRDHRAVGAGIIDFFRMVATLRKVRFEGPLVFELEEPDVVPALIRSRDHLLSCLGSTG